VYVCIFHLTTAVTIPRLWLVPSSPRFSFLLYLVVASPLDHTLPPEPTPTNSFKVCFYITFLMLPGENFGLRLRLRRDAAQIIRMQMELHCVFRLLSIWARVPSAILFHCISFIECILFIECIAYFSLLYIISLTRRLVMVMGRLTRGPLVKRKGKAISGAPRIRQKCCCSS
jgi:hypothetical protein